MSPDENMILNPYEIVWTNLFDYHNNRISKEIYLHEVMF